MPSLRPPQPETPPPDAFTVQRARVADDMTLAYLHEGRGGHPLLLVHGYPETKRIWWRNVAPLAAAGFEVIVPDLRGHGDSDLSARDAYELRRQVSTKREARALRARPQLKRWSDHAIAILPGTNTLLQLLTAGNETTTSLIGSALRLLLQNPDVEARIRADRALLEPFLEEVLRLESPLHGHFRLVRRDTEVARVPLPQGSRVMLLWGATNRDGDEFPNPDTIDLSRPNARAHLAFGLGVHHCIGAALARLETRVTFETLLARTSRLRLTDAKIAHVPSLLVRSLASLPVQLAA